MHYYKNSLNSTYALSDQDIDNGGLLLLPADAVEITEAEWQALINPPPTTEQLIAAAVAEKLRLTAICTYQLGVLTNATDPDVVDDPDPADAALLILWKKYQQALRKVVTTVVPVTWPTVPALASGTSSAGNQQT